MKNLLLILKFPIDIILSIFSIPSATILLLYRKFGSSRLPITTSVLRRIGVFPIRNHYYEPLFIRKTINPNKTRARFLPGLNLNINQQLQFLSLLNFSQELIKFDWKSQSIDPIKFNIENESFGSGDAEFLYQFLRHVKPRKIIEIGSGHSTKVANLALARNNLELGSKATHTCIEPYEMPWLESLDNLTIIRNTVEDCGLDWRLELNSGDLLFIDSSHMIRPGGDVLMEYLEILPRLNSGVFIHIHDIFTPNDYPVSWIDSDVRFWNEQYLLEALLSNTSRYEVIAAVNFLKNNYYNDLKNVCPYLRNDRQPGSFYIKVK
jgi:hypothetical protein